MLSFTTPAGPANQFGFALGDIDSESVQITAVGTDGTTLTTAELGFQGVFNYVSQATYLPIWDAGTSTLQGNINGSPPGTNAAGGAGWFQPTRAVQTLTLTGINIRGSPTYQLWLAGFAC